MTGTRSLLLPTCDVYDIAMLAGGLPRVVDTAVVTLLERGRLEVDGTGRLRALGSTPGRSVEAAVLELAGPLPRRSIGSLRLRASEDPRLMAVAERLVAAGLLRRNRLAGRSGSWPVYLRTAAGRRVLTEWRAARPAGSGADVALGGADRMADRALYASVFGAPPQAVTRRSRSRTDPGTATWAYGGWGGGWGGGDGGGCGGGDGGGGGGC